MSSFKFNCALPVSGFKFQVSSRFTFLVSGFKYQWESMLDVDEARHDQNTTTVLAPASVEPSSSSVPFSVFSASNDTTGTVNWLW